MFAVVCRVSWLVGLVSSLCASFAIVAIAAEPAPTPLRILLVTGGCCHDYTTQKQLIKDGLEERAHVVVTHVQQGGDATNSRIPLYEKADWAAGYDLVIHDECFSDVKDVEWGERVLAPHKKGLPGVVLHCALHSYQNGTDNWRQFCGVTSRQHGAGYAHEVLNRDGAHPIMQGFGAGWANPAGELYWIEKVWPTAHPLAASKNRERGTEEVCVWTNDYQGTRVFGTTLGHHNETVGSPVYLDLLARGVLWACDKPAAAYLKPPKPAPRNLALGKKASASSSQDGHDPSHALDGKQDTRWCADGPSTPQWWQVDLGSPRKLTGCQLSWEDASGGYRYKVEGSADGKAWNLLADRLAKSETAQHKHAFEAENTQFVRITCEGANPGRWVSLWEVKIFGEALPTDAAASDSTTGEGSELEALYAAPPGYEATLFAVPPAVQYPVYVAAAPDGVLYVSVDKNGSLDREKNRGAVYRLRDIDGDGRADESKLFIPNVDSPRGLVWDRDRLYLMHPPHLSAYIDTDGDGQADKEEVLVKNIAFDFQDRPADHTSNGVTLGIDGWLYLAIGDFGFLEAEGTDGRKLQFRGGGVVRVRPDGTELQVYSRGTRNILEVALDPLLNGYTRDNTNDGGGWDIRLHHFTGLEDHGYPRLFKNFGDEVVQPLADYGGGSGCGALFLDEPGFPQGASPAAYTADWGRSMVYSHRFKQSGATVTADQQEFLRLDRVTDLDVDANSHIYATSWHGAVFNYAGEDVGFVVRLTPKGYQPEPLIDYAKSLAPALVEELKSPSHRRRLAAQRELLARKLSQESADGVLRIAAEPTAPLASRVAALFTLKQGLGKASHAALTELAKDGDLRPFAVRALADREREAADVPAEVLATAAFDTSPRTRLETAVAIARVGNPQLGKLMIPLVADSDAIVAHTAIHALARLKAHDACFAALDSSNTSPEVRAGVLRALQGMHDAAVVDGLIERLASEKNAERQRGLLSALCRLANHEGKWNGSSWGTRPDTTGPYYQPEPWEETPKILAVLKQAVDTGKPADTAWLLGEASRNRVRLDGALERLLTLVANDRSLVPATLEQLKREQRPPAAALPLLRTVALDPSAMPSMRAEAALVLLRYDDAKAFAAVLEAINPLHGDKRELPDAAALKTQFLLPATVQRNLEAVAAQADKLEGTASVWAEAGLLTLAASKDASPEAKAAASKSIETGWNSGKRKAQILTAAHLINDRGYERKVVAATKDSDPAVVDIAKRIVADWKLDNQPTPAGPLVQSLKPEEAIAQIMSHPGDAARGEQVFARLNCAKCHTVKPGEALRGPFLPQVAKTYKREQLAEAVLLPSKSIAQGFVTTLFLLDNGKTVTGFVTNEGAEEITLRDAEGREIKLAVAEIEDRKKQEKSIMPDGIAKDVTIDEFGALISYLESLAPSAGK